MSEIEKLLNELREKKEEIRRILNNRTTWSSIGQQDLETAGFKSEEELAAWIENNPYNAIS